MRVREAEALVDVLPSGIEGDHERAVVVSPADRAVGVAVDDLSRDGDRDVDALFCSH